MTAWRRASDRRWTCRKLTNVRAAASSRVNVASTTTAAGSWPNAEITSTATALSVASIGTTSIAWERPVSISRGRGGRQIAKAMHETPAVHQRYSEVPTS